MERADGEVPLRPRRHCRWADRQLAHRRQLHLAPIESTPPLWQSTILVFDGFGLEWGQKKNLSFIPYLLLKRIINDVKYQNLVRLGFNMMPISNQTFSWWSARLYRRDERIGQIMEAEPISEQKLEWMELNLEFASRNREPRFVGKTVWPLPVSGRASWQMKQFSQRGSQKPVINLLPQLCRRHDWFAESRSAYQRDSFVLTTCM